MEQDCRLNNKELINRCNAHMKYSYPYPNATITGDFDVPEQVFNKAMRHPLQSSFKWVPGHQNREKSLEELDHPARMNVEANRLAGEHNDTYGAF